MSPSNSDNHQDHQAFARDVVALARQHGVQQMQLGFSFGDQPATQMVWNATNTIILEMPKPVTVRRIPWQLRG